MRVAVIGAGSVGSQAAWRLASAGAEVEVFERHGSPNPMGAHAGESRLYRTVPLIETAPQDVGILAACDEAWTELEAASGSTLVHRVGGLVVGDPSQPSVGRAAALLEARGTERRSATELRGVVPFLEPDSHEIGVLDDRGGLIDPQAAVRAALAAATRRGAVLHTGSTVVGVEGTAGGVDVATDRGARRFDRVVVAPGAYASTLLPGVPVHSRRLLLGWFSPEDGRRVEMPSFVWLSRHGFIYGGPSWDGATLKLGVDAPWGDVLDPDEPSGREVTTRDAELMLDIVRSATSGLRLGTARFEMHVDGWSHDEHGLLGSWQGDDRVIVATGWSGHGFKISPVIGTIAKDLVLGEDPGLDISHLDPARF
jgi:sarcosine oxidase